VRRHLIIPDTQIKPGVPLEHIVWAGQAIVDYMPDVVVVIGDWWDMPSLSGYIKPGSLESEGLRVKDDVSVGNYAFEVLTEPMVQEQQRRLRRKIKQWNPQKHYFRGNHEQRIERALAENPKLEGIISYDMLNTRDFVVHDFLEIAEIDGIAYSHYFANTHSGRPIGGSIDNRLNRIGKSFVQGHEQGLLYGIRQYPGALTRHGLVAGSFYLHEERYRGAQGNDEWRGIVVLNEVNCGKYDVMPLSMDYLRRKYG
jgi:hypothetical protein